MYCILPPGLFPADNWVH